MAQTIRDIAAHEFFHILTPLNIHSEQIHDFDYIQPEMSKHLWLYEGVTEYAAGHMQVKYGLMDLPTYLDVLRSKMANASSYQDLLPFTQMSEEVLEKYQDQYGNVYEKGALIGLCLDIALLKHSGGKYNLQQLMRDLAKNTAKTAPSKMTHCSTRSPKLVNCRKYARFLPAMWKAPNLCPLPNT